MRHEFANRLKGAVRGLDHWDPLPDALAEGRDLKRRLEKDSAYGPVALYGEGAALEEVLKQVTSPRLLALSTHGFFVPSRPSTAMEDPNLWRMDAEGPALAIGRARLGQSNDPSLQGGLVLAGANQLLKEQGDNVADVEDGWVTAAEVSELKLRGTELVILSACETGLGGGDRSAGVMGLRRGLILAGAESLAVSLFSVPSSETRDLFDLFWQQRAAGESASRAMHRAQRSLIAQRRQDHGVAHPLFWAGFVLIGSAK
jgi:CHAT domain-containing protein